MESINIQLLEQKLKANPFVESAKVYEDMDGIIRVEISQRQPMIRIMNQLLAFLRKTESMRSALSRLLVARNGS